MKPYLNLYQINLPKFTTNSKKNLNKKNSYGFVKIGYIWTKIWFYENVRNILGLVSISQLLIEIDSLFVF